ncbi:uncharacterized protein K444DRAFT_697280 [Hyaloscypha bicolor E]|uniref:Uncharacterized protein n=1 Tax=Hyaloscypha bicolor E TaxID=1095630 RepID=A0A2J6SX17_9HELO|nr:uncharacterized protein K444DRAFT_697280 [Hyaloscypha bicolor E]PMD55318.1 hypothetical protein K444DRAFT_697280 [Hyaloscypha bicolor E]
MSNTALSRGEYGRYPRLSSDRHRRRHTQPQSDRFQPGQDAQRSQPYRQWLPRPYQQFPLPSHPPSFTPFEARVIQILEEQSRSLRELSLELVERFDQLKRFEDFGRDVLQQLWSSQQIHPQSQMSPPNSSPAQNIFEVPHAPVYNSAAPESYPPPPTAEFDFEGNLGDYLNPSNGR